MRLIFIRHGDPDYDKDTLTEKGWKEAELLADRICGWNVKDFYCSPLGRAKDTASPTLDRLHRKAVTHDWLQEFFYPIEDPVTGRFGVPWDLMPSYWTKEPLYYDRERWLEAPLYQTNPDIGKKYREVCGGMDALLSSCGYHRKGLFYSAEAKTAQDDGDQIVFFCHLGVTLVILSHLLGISPAPLWHGFFLAPTSVTVMNAEKRLPGEAYFRVQLLGDTRHLHQADEPVSTRGAFSTVFND